MKASEIMVGGHYVAKVSGNLVTVRVDAIRERQGFKRIETVYDVTNLRTGRKTTFRSAAKFRSEVKREKKPTKSALKETDGYQMLNDQDKKTYDRMTGKGYAYQFKDGWYWIWTDGRPKVGPFTSKKEAEEKGPIQPADDDCLKCGTKLECNGNGLFCPECDAEDKQSADPTPVPGAGKTTTAATAKKPSSDTAHPETPDENKQSGLLAGLIQKHQTQIGDGKVAGYTPTEEQAAILEAARAIEEARDLEAAAEAGRKLAQRIEQMSPEERRGFRKVLVICAGAGAGKTSTLRMLEEVLPGRGQYTAFNTSLVAESKAKFKRCKVNTTHSLAFGAVGKLYAHRLNGNRVYSEEIATLLGIAPITVTLPDPSGAVGEDGKPVVMTKTLKPGFLAYRVAEAVKRFCQSADREIDRQHFTKIDGIDIPGQYVNQNSVVGELVPFARKLWADFADPDGKMPMTKNQVHDGYVKVWQLGEGQQSPIIPSDYILLDEAQDTAPVFLDVLKRQSALTIFVGDDCQQIYEWRGACNAMKAFPDAPRKLLSQSFRFGQAIADVANSILADLDEPTDLVMKGCDIPSQVILPQTEGPDGPADSDPPNTCRAVLCRTNAAAVATVLQAKKDGKRPHLIGGGAETVAFVKAAEQLQRGRGTSHPELCLFKNWSEVQAYVKEDEGSDLKLMIKIIDEFGCQPILDALENMPKEENADLVVSTAHKSKGREWTSVRLASDFPPANRMGDADRRLLYVAATRAQHLLDLSVCTPFLPGRDKDSGKEVEPIRVAFTKPVPTAKDLTAWQEAKKLESTLSKTLKVTKIEVDPSADGIKSDNFKDFQQQSDVTYTKLRNGDWGIRSAAELKEGEEVVVTTKAGAKRTETVGKPVWNDGKVWIYTKGN